ncbi:MAG: xanthine dehydrogenase family protein subunit M [Thermoleophilia bacterium]|nr:xanthine dehydrogenase family protein subunit M [Thermoleophilia bacterium]
MGNVAFHTATTVDEALALLGDGSDARVVAGGSDLIVQARHGKSLPGTVIAIHRIAALDHLESADGLTLGALTSHATIAADAAVRATWTALADASALVGSHATRNVGTIGGNVMNASPAMETGGPLIVLGASVTLRSAAGDREVAIEELWTGPGTTSARPGEICVAVSVPTQPANTGSAYVRLEYRRAMEIAIVGASACVTLDDNGIVTDAKIALTALAPTIIRSPGAEVAIVGSDGNDDALAAVAAGASADAKPISDLRANEDYRRAMAGVIAKRAVAVAAQRARGEEFPIPATPVFMKGSGR